MTLLIRSYDPADRAACETVFRSNIPGWFREHELPGFLQFIDAGKCPYFVLEQSGDIVACGGYGRRPGVDIADLCWGMVARESHGNGIGSRLVLMRLQKIAADTHFIGARLGTSQLTEGFYRRFGFVTVERKKDGIDAGLDAVEMRLEFTPGSRKSLLTGGDMSIGCAQ